MPSDLTDRIKFELTLAALHAEVAELQQLTLAGVRDDTTGSPHRVGDLRQLDDEPHGDGGSGR
jgi:hypothetical protein